MTCDNIDSDATVFAEDCIIFVHYAMLCLEFISVCMYACAILVCLFYTHPARVFSILCIVIRVSRLSRRYHLTIWRRLMW